MRMQATKRLKLMACEDCEELTWVGANKRKAPLCLSCALKRALANQRQLREKSGPYYDRWLESQKKAIERAIGGRGGSQ